ncbi:hypothetical protein [Anaerotalea alkaliphila]|uniref:Uncharacterized protein n=1 Tax=Anaerotalea alkaliphila TaxID=2662126 RepID=A0A7X5KNB7_9FIRM|nr:hypothetical protein [Anaerotalea alkaliphila]NDL67623.1 hypothetical protein [Anaerotalea alkaliphila]
MADFRKIRKDLEREGKPEEALNQLVRTYQKSFGEFLLAAGALQTLFLRELLEEAGEAGGVLPECMGSMDRMASYGARLGRLGKLGQEEQRLLLEELKGERDRLERCGRVLSAVTDQLSQGAYMLERLPGPGSEGIRTMETDEDFVQEVLAGLFSNPDRNAQRELLKYIYSVLPVRMTASRFHHMTDQYFERFKGLDRKNVSAHKELLWEVFHPEGLWEEAGEIGGMARELQDIMGELDAPPLKHKEALLARMERLTEEKDRWLDLCVEAAKTLNGWIGLLQVLDPSMESVLGDLLDRYGDFYARLDWKAPGDTEGEREFLESLEGIQEQRMEEVGTLLGIFEETGERHKSAILAAGLSKYFREIRWLAGFTGNSAFPPYEEPGSEEEVQCDDFHLATLKRDLSRAMEEVFRGDSRMRKRARMAALLGYFNILHKTPQEIHDFLLESMQGCGNPQEKVASMMAIREGLRHLQ